MVELKLWLIERTKARSYCSDDKAAVIAETEAHAYKLVNIGWMGSDNLLPENSTISEVNLALAAVLVTQSNDG